MDGIKGVEAVFQFEFAALSVVEQDQQASQEGTQGRLIPSRTHIGQQEEQDLPDPVSAANIKRGDEADPLHSVVTADQLGQQGEERDTEDL